MIKPVLFVDIDGVMANSQSWWLTLYNFEHGTSYTINQLTEWDTRKHLNVDFSPYFSNYDLVEPIEGSLAWVSYLSTIYRIVYATSGQGSIWLHRYISNPEIVVLQDKSLLRGFGLIDDRPDNLDVFQGERFLLRQPWNTNRGLNDSTWDEIGSYLINKEVLK